MKLNLLTTALVLFPLCFATPLSAQTKEPLSSSTKNAGSVSTSSVQTTHKYPRQIVQEFVSSCSQQGNDYGINMEQFCTCSMNKFQNHYSFEQFITTALEFNERREFPQEMKELMYQCAIESL